MSLVVAAFLVGTIPTVQQGSDLGRRSFQNVFSAGIDNRFWNGSLNGGNLRVWNGVGLLTGNGGHYPFFISKSGMLPVDTDWNASVDFACVSIQTCGAGVSLRNLRTGKDLFRVHIDKEQNAVQLWLGDSDNKSASGSWNGQPMKLSVNLPSAIQRYSVEKRGNRMTLVYNGVRLIDVTPEPGEYAIRIGSVSANVNAPGPWSELAVSSVRVDYLTGPLPAGLR